MGHPGVGMDNQYTGDSRFTGTGEPDEREVPTTSDTPNQENNLRTESFSPHIEQINYNGAEIITVLTQEIVDKESLTATLRATIQAIRDNIPGDQIRTPSPDGRAYGLILAINTSDAPDKWHDIATIARIDTQSSHAIDSELKRCVVILQERDQNRLGDHFINLLIWLNKYHRDLMPQYFWIDPSINQSPLRQMAIILGFSHEIDLAALPPQI